VVRKGRVENSWLLVSFLRSKVLSVSTSQVAIGTAIGNDWTTTGQQLDNDYFQQE